MRVVTTDNSKYLCTMKVLLATLSLLAAEPSHAEPELAEPSIDTLRIEEVEVVASLKHDYNRQKAISATSLSMRGLEQRGVASIKDISLIAPNFYQPEYGSSITSSIYVRGFGSRIDQPVMGVTIDDVPVMNKNSYDFDFYDIRHVELLRGPQGTLYGRNTSGGVMNITTLSPEVWQGARFMAEYATLSSARASAAYYTQPSDRFALSIAANYAHDGGFFRNEHTDDICDRGNQGSLRLRMIWNTNRRWRFENSITAAYTSEGGYAYRPYDMETESYGAIAYNDPAGYERLTINEGFVVKYTDDNIELSSVTSYQLLDDTMTLDQDFTPKNMFTLQQMQTEHTLTEEIVIRNADKEHRWQWLCGAFGFAKWLEMSSPVTFKRDGIDELILQNANKGIHTVFPDNNIVIPNDSFLISSDFRIPTYGIALYHQSTIELGAWRLIAGLRLDYERSSMRYDSWGDIDYKFDLTMKEEDEYHTIHTVFRGKERQSFFELLPKIAAEYHMSRGSLYATVTRGYKAGGFNTQIFSDILQVKMMDGMMKDLGITLDSAVGTTTYDTASATRYKPETSWNFEIGAHLTPVAGLNIDASLFWIECFDQQVTVLPKGNNTGRMMSNAARARSYGVELSAKYSYKGLDIAADYGYTNAKFRNYDDGTADYSGRYLPYAPQNTLSLMASYRLNLNNNILDAISFAADWRGVGRIYWDESNTLSQPFYMLLGFQVMAHMGNVTLSLWGHNITNTEYDVFYFKSVGKSFFSKGRPMQYGIRLNINI